MFSPVVVTQGGSRRISYCRRVWKFLYVIGLLTETPWLVNQPVPGPARSGHSCVAALSKLTYSSWFVQCGALRKVLSSRSQAEAAAGFAYGATAIELGVFPTAYVKRGFKFPLLTPNA